LEHCANHGRCVVGKYRSVSALNHIDYQNWFFCLDGNCSEKASVSFLMECRISAGVGSQDGYITQVETVKGWIDEGDGSTYWLEIMTSPS
jgi:hypothetical protein